MIESKGEVSIGWISGMPRSGTTWLSQIFASAPDVRLKACPLYSYEFKNSLDENSTVSDWKALFGRVYNTNSEFLDQEHLRKHGLIPYFKDKNNHPQHLIIKSNRFHHLTPYILRLTNQVRFIHIVRHPCATIYSWLSNPNEFPKGADPLLEWKHGACRKTGVGEFWGFEDWKTVTLQALQMSKEYPNQHIVVRYEDLVRDSQRWTEELFSFLGVSLEKQTRDFITLSHSRHDNHNHSVFKDPSKKNQWETMLDPMIIKECFEDLKGTELERFLHV